MKQQLIILIIIILAGLSKPVATQGINLDSLFRVWNDKAQSDSCKLDAMFQISWYGYLFTKPDSSFYYAQLRYDLAKILGLKKDMAAALNTQGASHYIRGDYASAIEYHTRSLTIREEINDLKGIAGSLGNIGAIYDAQNQNMNAIDYFKRSLAIKEEIGDTAGIAISLNNIGTITYKLGNPDLAAEYYNRSLAIREKISDQQGIANCLGNLGMVYNFKKDYAKSMDYQVRSLAIREKMGDKQAITISLNNIAMIYVEKKEYNKSIKYSNQALDVAREVGAAIQIRDASNTLYEAQKYKGYFESALDMYELYVNTNMDILKEENQSQIIHQRFKYNFDKKHLSDSLAFRQQKKLDEIAFRVALEKEARQRYALYIGLGFMFILGVVVFVGYQRKKKDNILISRQKKEVEKQKDIVDYKNKEITDSITYAKRIQQAILPPTRVFKECLPNSFVLYKPKDIVAGDFYWLEVIDAVTIFAAADCTGHGVPGAMVSVVCNNAMNRAVREFDLRTPGKILDKTRSLVIETFAKSDEDVKDGMDIALCSIKGNVLNYAGANNPLWIIRNGELLATKADKQPIGHYDDGKPYTNHEFELQLGDSIYLFSDGFADQFGGARDKKFTYRQFKELLLKIYQKNMNEQRDILDKTIEAWKQQSGSEQIDDICVVGVRIT